MKKKCLIMMLTFVMAGTVFAGCGEQQKEEAKTEAAAIETPKATETPKETETPAPTETPEETVVMYTLANVPLRADKSKNAEKLDTVPVNTDVEVLEEGDTWCHVNTGAAEGYIARRFLSLDKQEAEAAAKKIEEAKAQEKAEKEAAEKAAQELAEKEKAEQEAREAKEQAAAEEAARIAEEEAARAAQQQAEIQAQGETVIEEVGQEKYEVSRENFDDCDGSGHGYAIIHYSDGSTEQIEY